MPAAEPQRLLDALSSPIRREILWLVWERELPAGDIAAAFSVTPPTISQHLAVLRDAGLVEMRADGNFRRYLARQDAFEGLEALLAHTGRWRPPEQPGEDAAEAVSVRVDRVVVASVAVDRDPVVTFSCLTDPERCSRWVGAPVTIEGDRFVCTTTSGLEWRGVRDLVAEPHLIALRWEADGDAAPVPGRGRTAYLRVAVAPTGALVEVHQHAATDEEAEQQGAFWQMALARLRANIGAALEG